MKLFALAVTFMCAAAAVMAENNNRDKRDIINDDIPSTMRVKRDTINDEFPLIQGEEQMAKGKNRNKRYVFINSEAPILLGFLLNMPISLALPSIATGRSLDLQNLDGTEEHPEDLTWDPAYTDKLGRLNVYFAYLELMSMACQERLICDMAAAPETYSPIAEIILKEIRQSNGPVKTTQDNLMWRYISAARTGFVATPEDCAVAFPQCPLAADKILNMPVLKVWQYIASKLNMKLV